MNLLLRRHRPLKQEEIPDPACYLDAEKESTSIHSQTQELLDTDVVSSHRHRRGSFFNLRSSHHPSTSLPQEGPRRSSSFAALTHTRPPSSSLLNTKSAQSVDVVNLDQNDGNTAMCTTNVVRRRSSINKIAFLLSKRRSSFFKEKDGVVVNSTANYQIQRTSAANGGGGMRGSSLRAMSMRKFSDCSDSDGSSNGDSDDTLTTKDEEGAEIEAADDLLLVSENEVDMNNGAAVVTTDPMSGDGEDDSEGGGALPLPLSVSDVDGTITTIVTPSCPNHPDASSNSSARLDGECCAGSLLITNADNRIIPSDDTIEELEPTTTTTTAVTSVTTDGDSCCSQPRAVGSMDDLKVVNDSLRHRNNNSQQQQQRSRTPRRRPLKLGSRWKTGKTGDRRHSMIEFGISSLPSSLSPTAAAAQISLKGLDIIHSNRRSLCVNMSLSRHSKDIKSPQHGLLNSRGGNNGSAIFKKGRWLGPPKPNAAVQARIDAFNADDDEFCIDDYDLSGSLFELPSKRTKVGGQRQQLDIVLATEQKLSDSRSRCTTPRSRLSSTSTVVEGCAMGAEHYKRIFVSSARKLQWQSERRGIGCIVHIRNTMSRAGERYVEVSGGRTLDATQISRAAVADYYYSNSNNAKKKEDEQSSAQCESPLLSRRSRTFSSGNLANLAEEVVDRDVNVDATYPAAGDLPLTSPPGGRTASTELAAAAMASIASAAAKESNLVIEGFGNGDLVSLETNKLEESKAMAAAAAATITTTIPYRSRRSRKRQQLAAIIDSNCSLVANLTS